MAKKKRSKTKKNRQHPLSGVEMEKVVLHFQRLMGPEATVEHDQKLKDRLGHMRQIDVLIRGKFGGWPTIGIIECKDQTRPKGLDDVEAFAKKTEHLGAGLRLLVSRKGFTKTALNLAKHEHIHCLSLLPHDSHRFGIEIGEWWYGVITQWIDFKLTVFWENPTTIEQFALEEVLWQDKPVFNWFWREFVVTYRDRTRHGSLTIDLTFDHVTNVVIRGQEYPAKALSCSATGIFMKKRNWITYSGQAFFDWHTGKVVIPSGQKVDTKPVEENLFLWEDYTGEIPAIGDLTDSRLMRGVMLLTQNLPANLPIPDLRQLSSGTVEDDQAGTDSTTEFDSYSALMRQVIEEGIVTGPPPTEMANPHGVWSMTGR